MHAPTHAPSVSVSAAEAAFLANLPLIRSVIRGVCRRFHVSPTDQADFASSVLIKLIDDDYAVFRQFRGESGGCLRTFLYTVACRHLLDVRNREWGKWRPSRRAKRLGSAAVYLEELIYRQQTPVREAVAMVSNHPRWTLSTTNVRGLYEQLPLRPPRRRSEPLDETVEHMAAHARAHAGHAAGEDDAAGVREALLAALRRLDSAERRVLRMRFQQGLSIKQIAAETGADVHALYRRLPRILTSLRSELQARRLDGGDVSSLLGHLGDQLDSVLAHTWSAPAVGAWAERSTSIDGRGSSISR
jgi:RNA polymerase sigma factor (sigma-70 family)